jgi:hypothetical protein
MKDNSYISTLLDALSVKIYSTPDKADLKTTKMPEPI